MPEEAASESTPASPPRRGGAWQPGKSANPGGRPRVDVHVRQLARAKSHDAMRMLAEAVACGRHAAKRVLERGTWKSHDCTLIRVGADAAVAILDRAWGKPAQAVEITGDAATAITAVNIALHLNAEPDPDPAATAQQPADGAAARLSPRHLRIYPRRSNGGSG